MRFEELFGEAAWVQADAPCVSPEFRAVFDAEAGEAAQITVCGLGFFELFLNGRRVSDDLFVPANSHYHAYADCFCAKEFGEETTEKPVTIAIREVAEGKLAAEVKKEYLR